MTMMTMMMIVGPGSKSVFVERSVGKKERAEVDILGLRQKDEKCVLFEQLRGAAATIYWEEINRTISFCLPIHTGEKSSHTHTHAPEEEDDENGSLTKYFPRHNGIRIASPYLELSF